MSNPFDPSQRKNALAGLLSSQPPSIPFAQPSPGVSSLFGSLASSPFQPSGSAVSDLFGLGLLNEAYRRRSEWNDRFAHWERSESDTETQRIERARNMVGQALSKNRWLNSEGARIVPQGSFTNRTNTRLDADIDLRVQHPMLKIEYGPGLDAGTAWRQGGYYNTGFSFGYASDRMRAEIRSELIAAFGALALDDSGNKAIRVKGLEGSRSEVDVVPCFTLHHITGQTLLGQTTVPGTAILSKDKANWTLNYPDQHSENGRTKRLNTGLHFKRVVRIVKRLRADMTERGILRDKVPSFLVECLVHLVEDRYFTEPSDDRHGRVSRVLNRLAEILANPPIAYASYEINGIKLLFAGVQAWTLDTARNFVNLARCAHQVNRCGRCWGGLPNSP
jgi:hypothetical protein